MRISNATAVRCNVVPGPWTARVALVVLSCVLQAGCAGPSQRAWGESTAPKLPPLPILPPTALTADAGDRRAYLRWNLQLEDERVVGWKVLQLKPKSKTLTEEMLKEPHFVVRNLKDGVEYTFAVVGVLASGKATPQSNTVRVTPHDVGVAKVAQAGGKIAVKEFKDVELSDWAQKATFPDGQELIFDGFRPVDWKTRDGEHLLYPLVFGNGLDIGKFNKNGLPRIIPPEGLTTDRIEIADEVLCPTTPMTLEYRDTQRGTPHPYLTDPMTSAMSRHHGMHPLRFAPQVDGNRVTFHYWMPLQMMGYGGIYARVWETWWPIERDRHGCKYHGLARLVEVEMPSVWKWGYQVMLNNGFGPGGSRKGMVGYMTSFPGREMMDFSAARNGADRRQFPNDPRQGYGYHPNHPCLQGSPLIFYDWGKGSLTISARSLYYHASHNSSTYLTQGVDGVWPNLAWDMTLTGRRTAADTIEYLYTSDMAQPLPQRYVNARFEVYSNVSRRMGVQSVLAGTVAAESLRFEADQKGGLVAQAQKHIEALKGTGVDRGFTIHDMWPAMEECVDDAYRLDEHHGVNPEIKAMCDTFLKAGIRMGYWFRPELVKTGIPSLLSETMPHAATYNGYHNCNIPDIEVMLAERGIPYIRDNPHWIRLQSDGSWPVRTPYGWVPMSMASGWWDRIVWPTLVMTRKLGFDCLMIDGGHAGLQGVDYSPMLDGKTDGAVPCQPYWWRMFRSMEHLGIKAFGELSLGWKGADSVFEGPVSDHFIWMVQMSSLWFNQVGKPELVHRLHQLYNGIPRVGGAKAVQRYARRFYEGHAAPDWIEFVDLRQGEQLDLTLDDPAGASMDGKGKVNLSFRPWTWTDVIWHYEDGTQAIYPAYDKIDWSKQ